MEVFAWSQFYSNALYPDTILNIEIVLIVTDDADRYKKDENTEVCFIMSQL